MSNFNNESNRLSNESSIVNLFMHKSFLVVHYRFFETEPSMKRVFPKIVQMNDRNQLELDTDMEVLSRHASTVMHSLGAAVESLDHDGFFEGIIKNIGQSHQRRNVTTRMIEVQMYYM